jgi:hypothetical protein
MQVLQEFYVNGTRKIASPLPKDSARPAVNTYATWCTETTPAKISAAFHIEDESRIGLWAALIVSAAKSGATSQKISAPVNASLACSSRSLGSPCRRL